MAIINGVHVPGINRVAILRDVKANNTSGGNAAATYSARILNTLEDPTGIVLNPGAFTGTGGTNTDVQLGNGAYIIEARLSMQSNAVPSFRARARLQNTTDASTTILGANIDAGTLSAEMPCTVIGTFTVTGGPKTFQLQQRANSAVTDGYGFPCNFGDLEQYSYVTIRKIA